MGTTIQTRKHPRKRRTIQPIPTIQKHGSNTKHSQTQTILRKQRQPKRT